MVQLVEQNQPRHPSDNSLSTSPVRRRNPETKRRSVTAAGVAKNWRRGSNESSTDPINLYLQQIARQPLLTAKQEIEIASRLDRFRTRFRRQMLRIGLSPMPRSRA